MIAQPRVELRLRLPLGRLLLTRDRLGQDLEVRDQSLIHGCDRLRCYRDCLLRYLYFERKSRSSVPLLSRPVTVFSDSTRSSLESMLENEIVVEAHATLKRRQRPRKHHLEVRRINRIVNGFIQNETACIQTTASRPSRHLDVLIGSQQTLDPSVTPFLEFKEDHRLRRHVEPH